MGKKEIPTETDKQGNRETVEMLRGTFYKGYACHIGKYATHSHSGNVPHLVLTGDGVSSHR